MSHHFARPENALKRAEELLHVGQPQAALDSLHDVLSSKRHRTWTPVIEDIIKKYLDICISLKKGRMAKDGLIQYRIICQQVNVGSLEDVLRHFMTRVDAEASSAMAGAEEHALAVADLDAEETPESILISAMTGDDQATRTEREVVTPWLKFLWETFRTVLEILRSNVKLEPLYQETANKAFAFCVKYKRATELRRLCELLRNHLAALAKYQPKEAAAAGLPPDGLAMHLDIRYSQLNAAADLELWQEAYRTIEDIHTLNQTLKKPSKPSLQAQYYSRLAQVFLKSDNLLLHAYCLQRLVSLARARKQAPSAEEMRSLATAALLAAICAPITPAAEAARVAGASPSIAGAGAPVSLDIDLDLEKHRRIAAVLGFGSLPNRESLLADLTAKGVAALAMPEVVALAQDLERLHVPMTAAAAAEALLAEGGAIMADARCAPYAPLLRCATASRLLQELARVYSRLTAERASKLCRVLPAAEVELLAVRMARKGLLSARLDAASGTFEFGTAQSLHTNIPLRTALATLYQGSALAAHRTSALGSAVPAGAEAKARASILARLEEAAVPEHARMLQRKLVIERRKEELERHAQQAAAEAKARAEAEQAEVHKQERERLLAEARRRDQERMERERAEEEADQKRKLAEQLAEQRKTLKKTLKKTGATAAAAAVETDVDVLAAKTTSALVSEQRELIADERAEFEKRLETLRKKADHLERARREAEAPLLRAAFEAQLVHDREAHDKAVTDFVAQAEQSRIHALAAKRRLERVGADKAKFEEARLAARRAMHEAACNRRNEELKEARQQRREERRDARVRAAEEAARRKAEQERLEAEAKARAEAETARKAAEEEERKRLAEIEEKKKAKEAEIEARMQAERLAKRGPTWADRDSDEEEAMPAKPSARAEGGGEGPPRLTAERSWEQQPLRDSRPAEGRGGDSRFGGRGGDNRFGGPPRDDRFGGRGGDDRFGGRGGDDRFGRGPPRDGPRDDRFGGPPRDDRFGGRGGDDRFGRGPPRDGPRDDRFGGRGGDDRFSGRGGDDRFGGSRGGDSRFGGRGGDDRFGGRGGDDRFGRGPPRDGPPRDGPPRDGPPRDRPRPSAGGGADGGRWR